jgi:hypothetical protein
MELFIHIVPPKTTATGPYCCSVLKTLMNTRRKQPELVGYWMLHDHML